MSEKVERLKEIRKAQDILSEEKKQITDVLDDIIIYQNEDGTWTRFTKIDNVKELTEKESIFRSNIISRFTTKIENLKNKPKELKKDE